MTDEELMERAEVRAGHFRNLAEHHWLPVTRLPERDGETIIRLVISANNGHTLTIRVAAWDDVSQRRSWTTATATTMPGSDPVEVRHNEINDWIKQHSQRTD